MEEKGHSEEYFGDYRDYWYNYDFLELMAKRWELEEVTSILDVGCGMCHWSRLIANFLNPGTKIVAVDNDPKWSKEIDEVHDEFAKKSMIFSIEKADACSLPFPDNSFDAVTCQTVLIHIKDPLKAIKEMKRVLRPGGILFCAEPNNIASCLLKDSVSADNSIEEIIESVKYGLVIEKGKIKSGNGDNSLGDLVPGLFEQAGLSDIKTFLSDKTNMVIPPYKTTEMQVFVDMFMSDNQFEEIMDEEDRACFASFDGKYDDLYDKVCKSLDKLRQKN